MTTAQSFYLSDLEISTTATLASLSGADTTAFTGIDAYAELSVDASVMQSLFQFHTDASDVSNIVADDLKYKVVYTSSDHPLSSDFLANAQVVSGAIDVNANNNEVVYDYPRYLAQKLFNTFLGVDLFANETEIRTDLDTTARAALDAKLLEFVALGEVNSSGAVNPVKAIMDQIIKNQAERLSTLHIASGSETTLDGSTAWFYSPILSGDSIMFKLNVAAASGQAAIVDASISIPTRVYQIKLNVTGNNVW